MSYAALLAVPAVGPVQAFRRFDNAGLGVLVIWDAMFGRYHADRLTVGYLGSNSAAMENRAALWQSAVNADVKYEHRIVHAMTFDRVLIRHRDFSESARCLRVFHEDFYAECRESHLLAFADALDALDARVGIVAAAWLQTSVHAGWTVWSECGTIDRPFNLSIDHPEFGSWFLFDCRDITHAEVEADA